MPIKDLQRQGSQVGRLRTGKKVVKDGVERPVKLESFRFTTNSRRAADMVAELYGGQALDWPGGTERFEVLSEATELEVMVPPGQAFIRQDYEMWTAAGCVRRCDGETVVLRGEDQDETKPCICPADGQDRAALAAAGNACKPTTRLNVMLPDLPDLGVWRLDSTGFYAAVELGGKGHLLQAARDANRIIPAVLRLDKRQSRVPGRKVRSYVVPVLELGVTLRQLTTGDVPTVAQALAPTPARALTTGDTAAGGGIPPAPPAAAPVSPAQAYADLASQADDPNDVVALGQDALQEGLLDQQIAINGKAGQLGDYLKVRVEQLRQPATRPASGEDEGIVDGEVVEDGPTADDARAAGRAWAGA